MTADSTMPLVSARIWVVTDDSVMFYFMPIAWHSPLGGVTGLPQTLYFPPLCTWDDNPDTLVASRGYFELFGPQLCDSDVLNTNERRINIIILRFNIAPGTPGQIVTVDTCYDPTNGSLFFGLNDGMTEFVPTFVPGQMTVQAHSDIANEEEVPRSFSLGAYPNPFNAQTTISYSLYQPGPVTLTIYNIMGQKVVTLVDEVQQAGEHKVVWDAGDVSSGVYFGRLEAGDKPQQNIKIVLLK
jgi:hypothetical protein